MSPLTRVVWAFTGLLMNVDKNRSDAKQSFAGSALRKVMAVGLSLGIKVNYLLLKY